jgi:RHS repeat-associated protein
MSRRLKAGVNGVTKRCFAIVAVMSMLLVSFQVMVAFPASAEAATDAPNPAVDLQPTPYYGNLPAGLVDSISSPTTAQVSDSGEVAPASDLTTDSGDYVYWTVYGTYVFNKTRPEQVSLISLNATQLVREAYFSIRSGADELAISDSTVIESTDNLFVVYYNLLIPSASDVIAGMTVSYDFSNGKIPKITASVDKTAPKLTSWQVVWDIVPNQAASVKGANGELQSLETSFTMNNLVKDLKLDLSVEAEGFVADWSDAKQGVLGIEKRMATDGKSAYGLTISFASGETLIDPTVISSSTAANPTGTSCQRKVFWNDGYYWLFYNSGSGICYKYSIDGMTWSDAVSLPGGTTPAANSGFDVAGRYGMVIVGWVDTLYDVHFKKGNVVKNQIVWTGGYTLDDTSMIEPVAVAIANDKSFWIAHTDATGSPTVKGFRSPTGEGSSFVQVLSITPFSDYSTPPDNSLWYELMPYGDSSMAFLETSRNSNSANDVNIRVRYGTVNGGVTWTNPTTYNLGLNCYISPEYKSDTFSAVASFDGTIHIAYRDNGANNYIKYAFIYNGILYAGSTFIQGLYPTISLDSNNVLHIYCVGTSTVDYICHYQKPLTSSSWSIGDTIYQSSSSSKRIKYLSASINPIDKATMVWTEDTGSKTVMFGSISLPFGSTGSSPMAWERDGLSPYGTFFSQNGDSISPGTGSMIMTATDVSVPGRDGVDLSISRIYQQPRYFFKDTRLPYYTNAYPFCNLGLYWGLDLPWMNDIYVYVGNGERFIIHWGNNGNPKEFVNHDSVQFTLRDVTKGSVSYYELITSSGLRYEFNHSSYRLEKLSNLIGYNPAASTYSAPYNSLVFNYDGNNRLTSIVDSGLGRSITFAYNGNGVLSRITQPDGGYTSFVYASYSLGGRTVYLLTGVTDPAGRITLYDYNATVSYLMDSVTYPSDSKVQWTYAQDNTPATEVMSWFVTSEATRNATTYPGALIRQTSFNYNIINGKVIIATLTSYDGPILQGSTRFLFESVMGCQQQIVSNATGAQMQRTTTWFNTMGQPVRMDTYLGDSTTVNYTTYASYDGWGNVIFAQDALGQQTYTAYASSGTPSFKGGDTLTRMSSGLKFFDSFDDLNADDWYRSMGDAYNTFDVGVDPISPAMKIYRTGSGGNARLDHTFAAQSADFVIQVSFMSNLVGEGNFLALSGATDRIAIHANGGVFAYWSGSQWVTFASCSANTWYDLAFYIRPSTGTYDIYINGNRVVSTLSMYNSGNVNGLSVQVGPTYGNAVWFTNVRVYSGLTVTVNGLSAGYTLKLVDRENNILCSSTNGVLTIATPMANAPPAQIIIVRPDGSSFSSPVMDVWGGDIYTFKAGLTSSANFYPNSVKSDIHDRVAGSLTYQDYGNTVTEEKYCNYDSEGNPVEIKSKLGSGWTYAQCTYDQYGNMITSTDESGRMTVYDYSNSNGYTYPVDSRSGGLVDNFDRDTSWTAYLYTANGNPSWLTTQYSTSRAYSGSTSVQVGFANGPGGYDSCSGMMYKDVYTNSISSISVRMYCSAYSHNNGWSTEAMDSGVRMRLYDANGVNYANYTYWLACWYYQQNNRSAPDGYTKVICGQPTMNTWITRTLSPNSDWTIDWSRCDKVRFELYVWGTGAQGDYVTINYDDFTYDDSPSAGSVTSTDNFETAGVWQVSSYRSWLTGQYVTDRSYSPSQSFALSSSGASSDGQDYGTTTAWEELMVSRVTQISTRMYVSSYSHDGSTWDFLDSGIRMRLYDSSGNNYATYTYWLACWYQNQNTRSPPDGNTKVIYGQPTMNTWLSFSRDPNADWTIDWSRCSKVRMEIYVNIQGASGDQFKAYYDDLVLTYVQPAQSITTYYYDVRNGNLLATVDPLGRKTGYQYDILRRIVKVNNADGTCSSVQYDDQNNKVTSLDELNQKTVSYYDELGRLKKVERYGLSSSVYSRELYTYNWQDKVTTFTDEVGRLTRYTYDYLGRNTITQYFDGTSTPINVADNYESGTSWTPYTFASTSPTWLTAQYSTAQSYSPSHSLQVSFTNNAPSSYDSGGALMYKDFQTNQINTISVKMYCAIYQHSGGSWDDMDAGIHIRLYDINGYNYATYTYWLACWYQSSNNKNAPDSYTKVIYGQPTTGTWLTVSRNLGTDFTGIDWSKCDKVRFELYTTVHGAVGDQLQLYFDDFSFTGSYNGNTRTTTIYDDQNNQVTSIDENGNKVVSVLDYIGRLNVTREYSSPTAYYQTLMSYDSVGNLKTVRQANGEVTRMNYDRLNRETSITYPDSRTESWTYDYAGRVLTATDRSGTVTTTAYDTAGRTIRTIGTDDKYVTKYDANGQVIKTSNRLGSISYQYNNRDLVSSMTEIISGTTYTFTYTYDATGRLTSERYPDLSTITYVYDDKNRVTQVKSGNTVLESLAYNLDDSIATKSECNGNSTMAYTYNYRGWVASIVAKDRSGVTFLNLAYTYDNVGNVKSIVSGVGGAGTETYTYDALNRLTKAVGAWGTIQYGYDSVGNRLWINDGTNRTYSYSTYNKLSSDGSWTYSYDTDGNVIWKNSTSERYNCIYNSFGQMTSVIKWTKSGSTWSSSTIATYYYDANGQRARTVEGSTTTNFVYQGIDTACQFGSDGKTNKYIYVGGQLQLRTCSVSESYAYISDALGSTRYVLKNGIKDSSNIVYSAVTYKPFGTVYTTSGIDRITFAGETTDSPTGLVYLSARYMDPSTGRFYALDPELGSLSMPQTMNRYVYCLNNPMLFTDPTGMDFLGDAWNWVNNNWQTIAVVTVCVVATVATAGIASPALALAASMAIGGGASALDYSLNAGSSFTWEGLLANVAMGTAIGGVSFGAGAAISRGAASIAAKSINNALASGSRELSLGGKIARSIGGIDKATVSRILADENLPGMGVSIKAGSNWMERLTCRFQASDSAGANGFFRSDNCAIRGAFGPYSEGNSATTLAWEHMKPGTRYLYYDVGEYRAIVCSPDRVRQFDFYNRGS